MCKKSRSEYFPKALYVSFLQSCWQEYLTARIEQNLVMNCNCPITDCRAQPTSQFFFNILTDKDTIAKVCPPHNSMRERQLF